MHFSIIFIALVTGANCLFNETDADLPIKDLVNKYGYPWETHQLITDDGYILNTFRIPSKNSTKPPVVYLHGMGGCAENVIILGPKRALAFLLFDHGFDVWLMNNRGSFYSRSHQTLDPDKPEYWNFSFDEIALKDTKLNIDFILNHTNKEQLYFVGHSQGGSAFFALTSALPEYNNKIRMHISFAPGVFSHITKNEYMHVLSKHIPLLEYLLHNMGFFELASPVFHRLAKQISIDPEVRHISLNLMRLFGRTDSKRIKQDIIPFFVRTSPFGMSANQFLHYVQIDRSGNFSRYDFGPEENLRKYGTSWPTVYNLENVNTSIVIYYTANDWFAPIKAIKYLVKMLPNAKVELFRMPSGFNHFDYVAADNAKELLYDPVLSVLLEDSKDF